MLISSRERDRQNVCESCGNYANKCPDAKGKDGKGFFKVRQLEEPAMDKKEEKSIRLIRIRHSDHNRNDPDLFLRYWIKLYDLPVRFAISYILFTWPMCL